MLREEGSPWSREGAVFDVPWFFGARDQEVARKEGKHGRRSAPMAPLSCTTHLRRFATPRRKRHTTPECSGCSSTNHRDLSFPHETHPGLRPLISKGRVKTHFRSTQASLIRGREGHKGAPCPYVDIYGATKEGRTKRQMSVNLVSTLPFVSFPFDSTVFVTLS